jgi:Cys-rich four helix bundle protein (predicted Tat secretion target)
VHERGHQHGTDTSPKHPALVDAALDCVKTGQACLDHCLRVLKTGDTSLADCAVAVDELAATCLALSRLAALDSQHLPAFASVASKICAACEAECRKHAEHHAACATCAESCRECIAECKKVMA